jgi:hypothetical protein
MMVSMSNKLSGRMPLMSQTDLRKMVSVLTKSPIIVVSVSSVISSIVIFVSNDIYSMMALVSNELSVSLVPGVCWKTNPMISHDDLLMKNGVLWNVPACGSYKSRRFGGT